MIALSIAAATLAAMVLSGVYYAAAPPAAAVPGHASPQRSATATASVELVRSAAMAALLAGLVVTGDFRGLLEGTALGAAMWAIPVVFLVGSVFHEGTTVRSAGLHAGDWLIKLLVMGALVGWLA